jgi:hypothetical protein
MTIEGERVCEVEIENIKLKRNSQTGPPGKIIIPRYPNAHMMGQTPYGDFETVIRRLHNFLKHAAKAMQKAWTALIHESREDRLCLAMERCERERRQGENCSSDDKLENRS